MEKEQVLLGLLISLYQNKSVEFVPFINKNITVGAPTESTLTSGRVQPKTRQ